MGADEDIDRSCPGVGDHRLLFGGRAKPAQDLHPRPEWGEPSPETLTDIYPPRFRDREI